MKLHISFFVILFTLTLFSCVDNKTTVDENDDVEFEGNVVGQNQREEVSIGEGMLYDALLSDNEGLTVIANALRRTGLDSVLNQGGPYTLFAPSDKAFERLQKESVGYAFLPDSMDSDELRNILLHHVVTGNYNDTEVAGMQELKPMYGNMLKVIKVEGQLRVDSASITFADFKAENGYIHMIDRVLIPN